MEAKQAELAQLKAIESMSSDLVVQLESISDNFETLADGTKGVCGWRFAAVTEPSPACTLPSLTVAGRSCS